MGLCLERSHKYEVFLECGRCGAKKTEIVEIICHKIFSRAAIHRVGCEDCKDTNNTAPMAFCCSKGRQDIWNYPKFREGISCRVQTL